MAKSLVEKGYTILMFYLRSHSMSGKSKLGVEESYDVMAAVKYISGHKVFGGKGIDKAIAWV